MIKFSCPGCPAVYTVGDEKGGKTGKCPKCGSAFQIPMPEGAAPAPAPIPVPPPPPAPVGPAGDFSFGGDDAEDDTPKKKKKPASKADFDDEDDEDDAPPKSKGKSKFADEDDYDDDDDFDSKKKKKGKGGPAEKGKGLAIGAGVFHIIMALAFMGCGVYNGFCGSLATAGGNAGEQSAKEREKLRNDPFFKNDKAFQEQLKKTDTQAKGLSNYGSIKLGSGVCSILLGVLCIPAAIGCMMRKPFGKYLSFVVGPLAVLLTFLPLVATYFLAGSDLLFMMDYASGCGGGLISLIYAGFTIFAMTKAVPSAPKADKKKASKFADDDEDDAEDEKPAAKPSKYGKSKKVVEEEEDDDDDEEEEEKPKPKKRR